MFLSKSKVGIFVIDLESSYYVPSEVLTSQEAFKFEKLCWKNTKQNMSSLFIEALYFLLECC